MKRKWALYPTIVSICALFCFIVVLLLFSGVVQPLWGRMMPLVVPALLLGLIAFCAAKGKLGVTATTIWTTVLGVVLFIASVFYVSVLFVWTATTTTTEIKYYSRAYAQIDDKNGVKEVFPEAIPADAEEITFIYHPQFLQGGEVFELSYITTDENLTEWTTLLKNESEWIGSNEEWHSENNWSFDDVNAVRYQLYWDGGFNHGEMCYVLIAEESGCITFYYSNW